MYPIFCNCFTENRSIFVRGNQKDPEMGMRRTVPPVHAQGD
nr:hypothetical protein [uncultured Prevotella sp.]